MIFYHFVGLSLKQIKEPFLEGKSQTLKETEYYTQKKSNIELYDKGVSYNFSFSALKNILKWMFVMLARSYKK